MKIKANNRIFAGADREDFVGRIAELERLMAHGQGNGNSNGLVVLAAPGSGSSELLRQSYDRLFFEQIDVTPVYFEFKAGDRTARASAHRFLREFVLQTVAFRRRDPGIIAASPGMLELAEMAPPDDGKWVGTLVDAASREAGYVSDRAFVKSCFSTPMRVEARGIKSCVLIDATHIAGHLDGGESLLSDLNEIVELSTVPFVLCGLRRSLFAETPFETIHLETLPSTALSGLTERLAARNNITINDHTRDLAYVQMGGSAADIAGVLASAGGGELTSFERFQRAYTDEIFDGRVCRRLDTIFDRAVPDNDGRSRILQLMSATLQAANSRLPVSYWKKHSGLSDVAFERAIGELHDNEIVNRSSGSIRIDPENNVVCDHLKSRVRLEIDGRPRALAVGEALAANILRAPRLMARHYRQNSALGLRDLMRSFDGREVSHAILDYGRFKTQFRGASEEKLLTALKEDNDRIDLPHIVFSAHSADYYPRLAEFCEKQSSAIALGFADASENEEIAWIAAEIESKLEVEAEIAQFWCDRLEMAAVSSNFENYRIWLIAPEGFTDDALRVLAERNAFGSCRRQVSLLAGMLGGEEPQSIEVSGDQYEFVVPMGGDTEMIAAKTIEDIAKKHSFPQKAINQIKTAVVEACINAAEHSLSPDKKIYQTFNVDGDKLTITISNRGLRLADAGQNRVRQPAASSDDPNNPSTQRRGWGLKLMKGLMDDVRIDQTDDGTRITMVKLLKTA